MGEAIKQHESLVAALRHDHEQLDQLLYRLVVCARRGAHLETREALEAFATHLREHMEAEEQFVLARFAGAHLASAVRIRQEHLYLRELLADLEWAAARNALSEARLSVFATQLYVHAMAEERALYLWSETALPSAQRDALLRRLWRGPSDDDATARLPHAPGLPARL